MPYDYAYEDEIDRRVTKLQTDEELVKEAIEDYELEPGSKEWDAHFEDLATAQLEQDIKDSAEQDYIARCADRDDYYY